MIRVRVTVPGHTYDAVIERGLLGRVGLHLRELISETRLVFVVTVRPVRRCWGKKLMASLATAGFTARILEMPDGEPYKKLRSVELLAERLAELGADRDSVLLAFGGGIVGDVTGLLASLYMRGVNLVQIPTTVLAQVDASIGGKTGVNLSAGKNLLGTFHHPLAVLIDPEVLATLPDREFRAGLYESLKCGVIGNPELFAALERADWKKLRRSPDALESIISKSVKLKAKVVSADERESGLRRILNFGHTIGHALEADSGYRRFLHGEAVAWGMIAAAEIAYETRTCSGDTSEQIIQAVLQSGPLPKITSKSRNILRLLQSDKKTRNGVVHFVLPTSIGKVEIVNDVPESVVLQAVDRLLELSKTAKHEIRQLVL